MKESRIMIFFLGANVFLAVMENHLKVWLLMIIAVLVILQHTSRWIKWNKIFKSLVIFLTFFFFSDVSFTGYICRLYHLSRWCWGDTVPHCNRLYAKVYCPQHQRNIITTGKNKKTLQTINNSFYFIISCINLHVVEKSLSTN